MCPAGPRTQESTHTGWSVPTEWFPVHPPFCFNSSDWGGALPSFLLSSLISLITIFFQKCYNLLEFIPRRVITTDEVWKTPPTILQQQRKEFGRTPLHSFYVATRTRATPLALLSSVKTVEDLESRLSFVPLHPIRLQRPIRLIYTFRKRRPTPNININIKTPNAQHKY